MRISKTVQLHLVASVSLSLIQPALAQVFQQSPTASVGVVQPGTGQAFYGTYGLDPASDHSYSVYRKLDGVDRADTGPEIHTLTPLDGNASAAMWQGVDHGGSGTESGFHDPGMFIGNSPSTQSYADQLIYFGPNRNGTTIDDPDGGVGGDNLPNGTIEPDSNDRVNWEVSVGFLEDPNGFVDGRSPNSGEWDMWTGSWGTDGISMRLFFTATDSEDIDNSEWFSFNETTAGSLFPGAKSQSGDPDSLITGEQARDTYQTVRRRVGSGEEFDQFDGEFDAGGSDGLALHIGVGYDDMMELSWQMELNDPTNADPVRAREVRFTTKTGNLEYSAIFDPEGIPNEFGDPDIPWTDGVFEWQNATPVFYLGLDNGTDYGPDGASGIMGVFIPGDFNADGIVNDDDRAIVEGNQGKIDTTYSLGDIDQDGDTDDVDLAAFEQILGGGLPGDYNADGVLDALDIDLQAAELKKDPANQNLAKFDHNDDAVVDVGLAGPDESKWGDRLIWIRTLRGTRVGDVDFNGVFDSGDLVLALQGSKYAVDAGNAEMATWVEGDWNGDMIFDSGDLVFAFQDGGYVAAAVPAIPEPSGLVLASLGLLALARRARRRVG